MGNAQSEDNKKWQIRREMEAKEADFEQKRNAYFAGQCTLLYNNRSQHN